MMDATPRWQYRRWERAARLMDTHYIIQHSKLSNQRYIVYNRSSLPDDKIERIMIGTLGRIIRNTLRGNEDHGP